MEVRSSNRITVLVIDDEQPTLTMFRLFLEAYGYNVLCAANGLQGLELVGRYRPQIVFTDLKMPEIDGIEVLKRIKEQAPQTEVIVITGHGDMDLAMQALNLDASDFINKPIDRKALDAALARAEMRLLTPAARECRMISEQRRGAFIIHIEGTLSGRQEPRLEKILEKVRRSGHMILLLSFAPHSAIDGAGIGVLSRLVAKSGNSGFAVAAAGLSVNFCLLLKMVGLNRFMTLYETEQEALASVGVRENP